MNVRKSFKALQQSQMRGQIENPPLWHMLFVSPTYFKHIKPGVFGFTWRLILMGFGSKAQYLGSFFWQSSPFKLFLSSGLPTRHFISDICSSALKRGLVRSLSCQNEFY